MTTTVGPALGQGAVMNQATSYDAISARRAWAGFERGEGVATYGSFRVSQRGAGSNMSIDCNMDDGAWVRGDAVTLQGLYYVAPHSATINETITAAHATLPRIDQVVLEIKDHAHDASGSSLAQTRVVDGTATSGATLDNRTGTAALPNSALLLADVLVAAADTAITDAEIRDRRPFCAPGTVPPLLTDVDMVQFESPIRKSFSTASIAHASHDLHQAAVLCYLPRRIASATRLRWKYLQDATTAVTGNYVIGIYDASGRSIVNTGAIAFSGGTGSGVVRSETISATTFEPGWYYVFIGLDTTAGQCGCEGWSAIASATSGLGCWTPNMAVRLATGGTTTPTTLLGMSDASILAAPTNVPTVPAVALSVG